MRLNKMGLLPIPGKRALPLFPENANFKDLTPMM